VYNSTTMELDTLRNLIVDSQNLLAAPLVRRTLEPLEAPRKAYVCIGPRRAGKSTFLNQIATDKVAQGVARENFLFVNFQDDRLKAVRSGDFELILTAYYSLFPTKRGTELVYVFFDEIQEASGWELFVERLLRTEKVQIYLTGSSARLLSREIATELRGRALTGELWPFSFEEFLSFRGVDAHHAGTRNETLVRHAFEDYWERGGFPEVREGSAKLRVAIHQEYLRTMVYRDIIERHDCSHPQAALRLTEKLVSSIANLYTLNRLTEYLRSLGFKVQKDFVSDVLNWLEDAFVLFSVRLWDRSLAKQNVNPRKIYMVDHALAVSCDASFSEKRGYLLENLVFCHLKRGGNPLCYLRTKTGLEVDFRLGGDEATALIQVAWDLNDDATRARETKALLQAMDEEGLATSTLVTWDTDELLKVGDKEIRVVPVRKFLVNKVGS